MCTNATANTKKKWFRRERREREREQKKSVFAMMNMAIAWKQTVDLLN